MTEHSRSPVTTCVVCLWPVHHGRACGTCGWEVGRTNGLSNAQYRWDLAAAERATDDDAERELLRVYLRGTDPGEAPGRLLSDDTNDVVPPDLPSFVIGDTTRDLAVVGVSPRGLELTTIEIDDSGQTRIIGEDEQRPAWSELLFSLPGDQLRQRFHLAGGIGNGPGIDPAKLGAELKGNLPSFGLSGKTVLVAVSTTGWTLLDHFADRVRARYAAEVVWRGVGIDDVRRRLASLRPISQPYDFVMYDVLPDGTVNLKHVPLFPAGAVPGEVAVVEVRVPPGIEGPVVLPVMICRDTQDGESLPYPCWQQVSIESAELLPGRRSITARLEERDKVSFTDVGDVTRYGLPWPELLASIPERIPLTDLVFAVEYAGAEDAEARMAFVRDTLVELCERSPVADLVRVVLVGYGQHAHRRHRHEADDPLRRAEFASPAAAVDEIARWKAEPNRNDCAAAVEDALAAVVAVEWRENARRIVVFVANRPPYPTRQWGSDPAVPCPHRLNWQQYADQLRTDGVRRIAVLQPPRSGRQQVLLSLQRRGQAWLVLGEDGTYHVDGTLPHNFVKDAGLLGDGAQPPPFVRPMHEPGDQADRSALEVTGEF